MLRRTGILALAVALGSTAYAQTTGSIFGQVVDQEAGGPLGGVTVQLLGPHGEQTTITGDDGTYELRALPVGTYLVRFFYGSVTVEQPNVVVSLDKTIRVNARMPAIAAETVRVVEPVPAIDVGSSRIGVTLDEGFIRNVPLPLNIGGIIEKTPGGYLDPVGLSLNGATGAENAYLLDGLDVTSIGYGLLGTDLPSFFVEEVEVIAGGYDAEYGRSLGGVVNVATKSGSNVFRGSAFSLVAPGFLAGEARRARSWSTSLTSVEEPSYAAQIGAEVGGPIARDRLFFWVGYAPALARSRSVRIAERFFDRDGDGVADGQGVPVAEELSRSSLDGRSTHHQYAAKLTYRIGPDHHLSLGTYGIVGSSEAMRMANADPRAAMSEDRIRRHDVVGRWLASLRERRWQLEATVGLHAERTANDSPFADMRQQNAVVWNTTPSLAAFDPSVAARCSDAEMAICPVQEYQSGGYGLAYDRSARRVVGALKSTHILAGAGWHRLRYGGDYALADYDSRRAFSGPDGARAWAVSYGPFAATQTFFRLRPGERAFTRADGDTPDADPNMDGRKSDLLQPPWYQDAIRAETRTHNASLFLQDGWSPVSNLTFNLGARWEAQWLMDSAGETAIAIADSVAPRVGAVYDFTDQGRSKLFAHFGRFYESIPMLLNDRGFGGEGTLVSVHEGCDASQGFRSCPAPPAQMFFLENLLVQRGLRGSYSDELVVGAQVEALPDLTIGATYIKRWLGRAIEDAAGVVANPGDVPRSVIADLEARAAEKERAAEAPGAPAGARAEANEARFVADSVKTAAELPRPRRDYDALQLTAAKRFSRRWLMMASYTYGRTRGNYPGLYAADKGQLDPNYTSLYDIADLLINRDGPLPNDRPHLFRADGYYTHTFGVSSSLVAGLGAVVRSGRPNNALGSHIAYGKGETFVLPRGSMGRTPAVMRLDLHLGVRTRLTGGTALDAFVDIFNLLDQRTALTEDQDYTLDPVDAIVGGDARDLPHLKTADGTPVTKNPNFGSATSYQAPIAGRLGLRVSF